MITQSSDRLKYSLLGSSNTGRSSSTPPPPRPSCLRIAASVLSHTRAVDQISRRDLEKAGETYVVFMVLSQEGLNGISSFHGDGTFWAYLFNFLDMNLLVVMRKCRGRTLNDVTLESWMVSDDLMFDADAGHPASIVDLDCRYRWPI